jgi:hypothetical protein
MRRQSRPYSRIFSAVEVVLSVTVASIFEVKGDEFAVTYRFCPSAYCRGGSYSFAQGSFISSHEITVENCMHACQEDVACNVATWCPLCRPSPCLLFTACNLWQRDEISDSESGKSSVCEVPGTERDIATFLNMDCVRFSQRAVSFEKGADGLVKHANKRDCVCPPYHPPANGIATPRTSLYFGQRASISCNAGFELSGPGSASPMCLGDTSSLASKYSPGQSCAAAVTP